MDSYLLPLELLPLRYDTLLSEFLDVGLDGLCDVKFMRVWIRLLGLLELFDSS